MPLLFTRLLPLSAALLLISGCAEVDPGVKERFPSMHNSAPVVRSDVDDLLDFGANLANISVAARAEICRPMVKRQKESPETGILLQLMVGRLLSDTCGDIPKLLEDLADISTSNMSDDRLPKLIAIHTEALKRIGSTHKKLSTLERKQKTVQNVLESKENVGSKKDESRLLREKLDAIRTMEKQLDETSEGK